MELSLPEQLTRELDYKPVLVALGGALFETILPREEESAAYIEHSEVLTGLVGLLWEEY